jgi:hypothetical protein
MMIYKKDIYQKIKKNQSRINLNNFTQKY